MITFDKYQKHGAYHWKDLEAGTFGKLIRRSLPLYTRYQQCLRQIPSTAQVGIEIGCGDGALTYAIAEDGLSTVTGYDPDPMGIELARAQVQNRPFGKRVRFECNLFDAGDAAPGSLDLVVLADVLEHLEDPQIVLDLARKALCPGGRLILTTPHARHGRFWDPLHVREYTEESLAFLLTPFFPKTRVRTFSPWIVYNAYTLFRPVGYALNVLAAAGWNPLSLHIPGLKHTMLLAVSEAG